MPLVTVLLVEITSPVLALLLASFLVHELTALLDVSYAVAHREVRPAEQMVHSLIEARPLLAFSFVAALRWPQFLALFGFGEEKPDLSIRLRRDLPSMSGRTLFAGGTALSEALLYILLYIKELYIKELSRDLQATHRTPDRRVRPPEHSYAYAGGPSR